MTDFEIDDVAILNEPLVGNQSGLQIPAGTHFVVRERRVRQKGKEVSSSLVLSYREPNVIVIDEDGMKSFRRVPKENLRDGPIARMWKTVLAHKPSFTLFGKKIEGLALIVHNKT